MSSCCTCKGLQYHILICYSWIRIRMIVNIQWKRSVFCCSVSRGRTISTGSDKSRVSDKGPSSQSYGFSSNHVWIWELDDKKLNAEELMLLNCGVGEDSWESLGLQGDPTSPFWKRSALGFLWKDDAKAETSVLWPPHVKSLLIGKDCDAGRD